MISDLDLVNSADYKEPLHNCNPRNLNPGINFEPFALDLPEENAFEHYLRASSYLECLIAAASNSAQCKLDEI